MGGCICKRKEHSWTDLLNAQGRDLWNYRRQSIVSSVVFLNIDGDHNSVCVYSDPSLFRIEEEHGMDKDPSNSMALTNLTGSDWVRERKVFLEATSDIKERSLEAARRIQFDTTTAGREKVDLKETVQTAALQWAIHLFRGKDDKELQKTFFAFWSEIRCQRKNPARIQLCRKALEATFSWDSGLLKNLHQSNLTSATDNAVNAMTAAFETTSTVVFWTLWNLSRTKTYHQCQTVAAKGDLEILATLKKLSTNGESVSYDGLSYLGRAIVETVRVYPPVWTLPRRTNIATKLDVVSANGATDCVWDPDYSGSYSLASFGVGKRACPAGTAALLAAHVILSKFVETYESMDECRPNRALSAAYLGPTLCVDGPQMFKVKRRLW